MRKPSHDLEQYLNGLAQAARSGDRLPPIRDLMRQFNTTQVIVQRAFQELKERGLIASQVGRGTYFLADGGAADNGTVPSRSRPPQTRSVLLFRRSISITRGRLLVEGLQRKFSADGHRVLEVSYTDPSDAKIVLDGLPHFDGCVIQSSFKPITIDFLSVLKEKCDVLAVDGMALIGMDIEVVGTEWGEPITAAINMLRGQGHQRICLAISSYEGMALQLGKRRFDSLKTTISDAELSLITLPHLPNENYEAELAGAIKSNLNQSGDLPFTALVAWGIEDGAKFRELLENAGVGVPNSLSVVLLGRTDLVNEHAGFFNMIGCSLADQIEYIYQAITTRWTAPLLPPSIRLIPVTSRTGQSVATLSSE